MCIICGQEKQGYPVEDDPVLASIRAAKQRLNISTGNALVCCPEDLGKAKAKRARFEKQLMIYSALGACLLLISLFAGRFPYSLVYGFLAAVFTVSLSLVTYYPRVAVPKTEGEKADKPLQPKEGAGEASGG